ncbi:hypothetical protein [Rathayibacter tanaceti]|uniref:Uncharacterized protein n=2 Tax=Rathayibacter tanaceti TaxID=1671680 RepID=A0A162GHU0_9MICO|nr:hypothetical protein [Rathayibacter tanaceti]KZX21399.1 hypothetical protein ACH61_01495 [Rathayibacter tanaceti]QHC54935.1 hypothetical protein GSU10_04270 [Rathayibacter tanaceti]TCO38476.1 hypothetical protein EV639_102119 [Rathayibacter tanaceti]
MPSTRDLGSDVRQEPQNPVIEGTAILHGAVAVLRLAFWFTDARAALAPLTGPGMTRVPVGSAAAVAQRAPKRLRASECSS